MSESTQTNRILVQNLLKNLPYNTIANQAQQDSSEISTHNPKYELFDAAGEQRGQKLKRLSVAYRNDELTNDLRTGSLVINRDYANFIYSQLDMDKLRRLQEMRRIATFAEVSDCVDEICDETIVYDDVSKELVGRAHV